MLLRKINAGISLLTTAVLLFHAGSIAVWMLSRGSVGRVLTPFSWVLVGLALIHAFVSIDAVVSGLMSGDGHKHKAYPKMNRSTVVQRASGVLMLLFAALHIAGAMGFMHPPKIVHGIVPPLFFILVMAHTAVSASKALITLGIGDAKLIRRADVVIKVICGITLIADIVGFYLYVW